MIVAKGYPTVRYGFIPSYSGWEYDRETRVLRVGLAPTGTPEALDAPGAIREYTCPVGLPEYRELLPVLGEEHRLEVRCVPLGGDGTFVIPPAGWSVQQGELGVRLGRAYGKEVAAVVRDGRIVAATYTEDPEQLRSGHGASSAGLA